MLYYYRFMNSLESIKWPPIDVGTEVVTTNPNAEDQAGWTEEALRSRKWGEAGIVAAFHDSHGLGYEVRHASDGSIGHYDPTELATTQD